MAFAASVIASVLDPLALLLFGAVGAVVASCSTSGSISRRLAIVGCCGAITIGIAAVLPDVRTSLRFIALSSFPPVDGYNPLPDIRGTSYFDNHADRFVASMSKAKTDAIKRQIDQEERDCRILAGDVQEYLIWQACRSNERWATMTAGGVQLGVGAVLVVFWRTRRRQSSIASV